MWMMVPWIRCDGGTPTDLFSGPTETQLSQSDLKYVVYYPLSVHLIYSTVYQTRGPLERRQFKWYTTNQTMHTEGPSRTRD